jgi:hypothetical protein
MRQMLNPEQYLGWLAASAVAVGSVLAARNLRRRRPVPFHPWWDSIDYILP